MVGYIYKITNKLNNKIYVGKHCATYFDNAYGGSGKILKQAYKKYGKDNFTRELICWCETLEELNKQEIYWIKGYRDRDFVCYNITSGGDGTPGMIPGNKGKPGSEEIKQHMRHKHKCPTQLGRHLSEETKKKLSLAKKGKASGTKKVVCDGKTFNSLKELARFLQVNYRDLSCHLSGHRIIQKGLKYNIYFVKEVN